MDAITPDSFTDNSLEMREIKRNSSVDDSEREKDEVNPIADKNLDLTHENMSEHRDKKWRRIVKALRNLKTRIQKSSRERDMAYADETDEGVASASADSSTEGQSTPGNATPKDCLTDTEEAGPSCGDVEGRIKSGMTRHDDSNVTSVHSLKSQESVAGDDVFKTSTITERSSEVKTGCLPEELRNSLVTLLSGIYGIMIVVLGLVLPLSETFVNKEHPYIFEAFYLYLYLVSMAFLIYVYTYLLRKERLFILSLPGAISRTLSKTISGGSQRSRRNSSASERSTPVKPLVRYNSTLSTNSLKRRKKIAYNSEVSNHTGSFYLRVGVIGFGIGSMIHSGLTFGHYFEVNHLANHCSDAVQAIKPFALLCFTFVQMYFIFMNSKMCVHKYKTLARFGLMHMSCTNICVWLRSVVVETLLVMTINSRQMPKDQSATGKVEASPGQQAAVSSEAYEDDDQLGSMPELNCNLDAMMGKILEDASVYLYPCTIEYSLVCACVLYVMWSNVGEGISPRKKSDSCSDFGTLDSDEDSDNNDGHHRMSVDCAASSKGLFLGILLFVVAVVCVVCFYVLTSASNHVVTGTLVGHVSEEIILVVAFVATVMASYQMREMHFSIKGTVGIEDILTLISISGLGLYAAWSIVASLFYLDTLHGRLTIITNLFMFIQAGSQATFTLLALRASARTSEQLREKPGRQCVTFLLICNFALWMINTFETQRLEHNQTQVEFYGTTAWSIFSHISVPLGIYFRFHSTVNLSLVWKKAWKKKDPQEKTHVHRQHAK